VKLETLTITVGRAAWEKVTGLEIVYTRLIRGAIAMHGAVIIGAMDE
jgi:hypothetical protein